VVPALLKFLFCPVLVWIFFYAPHDLAVFISLLLVEPGCMFSSESEPAVCLHQGLIFLSLVFFDLCSCCAWIAVGMYPDCVLELSDQKARGFLVLIALKWLFPEHVLKVFSEISVRT
jgi:hypothetical protein